jgi:hypothetical protein
MIRRVVRGAGAVLLFRLIVMMKAVRGVSLARGFDAVLLLMECSIPMRQESTKSIDLHSPENSEGHDDSHHDLEAVECDLGALRHEMLANDGLG